MSESLRVAERPVLRRLINVLWPSFLVAGVATVVLFTWLDPVEVAPCLPEAPALGRLEAYSLGFFSLWLLTAVASALTCYFSRPAGR
jgi:hypothetical protein